MSPRTVVVDGSNIATEGRQMPSLKQLDEAVRAYREEHPDDEIIVVVDATFAHRIPDEERPLYEEAAAHNELVYPPAGAVGRGDAFLLRIAEKTGAVVLSNDSFQEFHGEHDWLFDKGRLIGGTPVPGVGWIFVARTPVRGPKSREAVKEAKRTRARVGSKDASQPMPVPKAPPPGPGRGKKGKKGATPPSDAIAVATEEAVSGGAGGGKKRKRRKRRGRAGADVTAVELPTLNEPLTFIEFIAEHKLGSTVEAVVEAFASHGAFVLVGDARCYVPLSGMGDPPPRSAREVFKKGETRTFVVQALDAARRGIELAVPGFEHVAGRPTEETVEAEIDEAPEPIHHRAPGGTKKSKRAGKTRTATSGDGKAAAATVATARKKPAAATGVKKASAKKGAGKKAAVRKAAAPAKAAAKKATGRQPAAKQPAAAKKTAAKRAAVKIAVAKKGAVKKAVVKKAAAPAKAAVAKKATGKKGAGRKAVGQSAPAKQVPPTKGGAKQAAARVKQAAPTKGAAKKTAAKKTAAKKTATKGAAKR